MQVKSVRTGRTMKVVTLTEVTEVDDQACVSEAMKAAGEDRSSLFGTNVTYFPEYDEITDEELETLTAVVDLHTD